MDNEKYVSLAELKNLFVMLTVQLDELIVVVSNTDLRRVVSIDWLYNDIDSGAMFKVKVVDLSASESNVETVGGVDPMMFMQQRGAEKEAADEFVKQNMEQKISTHYKTHGVDTYITVNTKEEAIKFFKDIQMVKLEPFTRL